MLSKSAVFFQEPKNFTETWYLFNYRIKNNNITLFTETVIILMIITYEIVVKED